MAFSKDYNLGTLAHRQFFLRNLLKNIFRSNVKMKVGLIAD